MDHDKPQEKEKDSNAQADKQAVSALQAEAQAARKERPSLLSVAPGNGLALDATMLNDYADDRWKTGLKQAGCDIGGTLAAGVSGTVAWSLLDKAAGSSRYGIVLKLGAAVLAGGTSKVLVKGGLESAFLDASDRKTSSEDFVKGGVDALAAVAGFKAEQKFSSSYQRWLGARSGAHLGADMLQQQGAKILAGSALQRVGHNGLRGLVGGTVGSLVWATPNELYTHRTELTTLDGWGKVGKGIGTSTLIGGGFGGTLGVAGTAVWNARELAGVAKASILGKQGRYSLDVYHFNDSHSALMGEQGTMQQLVTRADQARQASTARGTGSVVLELGDTHSGTAASHFTNTGEVEARILHQRMRVEGTVPGNHLVDTGLPGNSRDTRQWMANMARIQGDVAAEQGGREIPGVAANVRNMLEPSMTGPGGMYQPYRIHVDPTTGERVGFTGLTTHQLQTATPKLVDQELAQAAKALKDVRWSDLVSGAAQLDDSLKPLAQRLAKHGDLTALTHANPNATVGEMIEQVVVNKYVKGLNAQQSASWREWFRLAAEHPETKLKDLARLHPDNQALGQAATHFPDKRVGDLHEIMCTDPLKALEASVAQLKAQGVDRVVVLSHLGKQADLELAAKAPAVSAIFGAHSHDLEPVPLWVYNAANKRNIMVSQAGSSNGWLGEANLVFNRDGSLHRYLSGGRAHVVDRSIAPDAWSQALFEGQLQKSVAGADLLGHARTTYPTRLDQQLPLYGVRGQTGEQTLYGNILTEAVQSRAQAELAGVNAKRVAAGLATMGDNVDAVLLYSGSIRSGLPAGPLDEVVMKSVFMNPLAVTKMSGEQIERALAFGVHDMPAVSANRNLMQRIKDVFSGFKGGGSPLEAHDPSGRFVNTGGLQYTFDRSLPFESRIQNLMIRDASGKFVPIDRTRMYTVATQDHSLYRWGSTPMTVKGGPAAPRPQDYVFGQRLEKAQLQGEIPIHVFDPGMGRQSLTDYLIRNSVDGRFVPTSTSLRTLVRDTSPGAWRAPVRPTVPAIVPLTAVSAEANSKR